MDNISEVLRKITEYERRHSMHLEYEEKQHYSFHGIVQHAQGVV